MEYNNKWKETHPIVVAGNVRWRDFTVEATWSPLSEKGQSGVLFRYRNDRCYYFLGVASGKAVLKFVKDGDAFRDPHEEVLAEQPLAWKTSDWLSARIEVTGGRIHATVGGLTLEANHEAFAQGRIALMADSPARFREVTVRMTPEAKADFDKRVQAEEREVEALPRAEPQASPVEEIPHRRVWRRTQPALRRPGRRQPQDVLVCQPVHHGPKDAGSEVSCLTAVQFDGKKIWQIGEFPDRGSAT